MKTSQRIYAIFLGLCIVFLIARAIVPPVVYNSLEDYVEYVNRYEMGLSGGDLDDPEVFLPSANFFTDIEYQSGKYYYFCEDAILFKTVEPKEYVILQLVYSDENYGLAKQIMTYNILAYDDEEFECNGYVFYKNANFANKVGSGYDFPRKFTMACYNDEKNTLVFIGYCNNLQENINDWGVFVEENFAQLNIFKVEDK